MLAAYISDERAGWTGLVGVVFIYLVIGVSVLLFDGYDWAIHDLSTLGHVDMEAAEQSRVVFSGGLVVTTLLGLVFSVGLYRLERRRLWQAGAVLYAISHLTVAWQGVFPAGVPQHNWLSAFPFFIAALLVLGIDQLRLRETRMFGVVVLTNLVVGLVAAGLLYQTDIQGSSIFQTIGVTVFSLVTLLFGARLLGLLEPKGEYDEPGL